jgi:hypothetical protein
MLYFISFLAILFFSLSPASQAAEDPSLDTLFGFSNQPPKSGEQPQDQKAPAPATDLSPQVSEPLRPSQPKPEPLFGAAPQKAEPIAPVVKTPESKTVAPVRILPSQLMEAKTPAEPKQDTIPEKPVVAQPSILSAPAKMPPKAEIKTPEAPKVPEVAQPAPVAVPVAPVKEDKIAEKPVPAPVKKETPAAPVIMPAVTPEPIKAEAPAPSVVKEEAVQPKTKVKVKAKATASAKPKATVSKQHSKKKIQRKEPPKMVMSDKERRQKTLQMLEKSYDSLSMALRINFPAFSSALPRQSKVDIQDRLSALKPEEIVILYGSASMGPKGTPNSARAVAQSRMDRLTAFMESLGVRADRIVTIDRSFTRQDSVDMAFVTVKTKRNANP